MSRIRLKRFGILLLGGALMTLGVVFFVGSDRSQGLDWLIRLWPVFLVLAGLVRVAGFVLDREPRSPVGGMLVIALGGILLAAGFRGDDGLIQIVGKYWFFLLLAFIGGRVLAEYGRSPAYGVKRQAFGPGTLALALLISGAGIGAHFVSQNPSLSSRLHAPFEKLTGARNKILASDFTFEDQIDQLPLLSPPSRLLVGDFPGDIEVRGITSPQPRALLIKRVSAVSEEEGRQIADKVHVQVETRGFETYLLTSSLPQDQSLAVALVIELPEAVAAGLELNRIRGVIKINGVAGSIRVSEPRSAVVLRAIMGPVIVDRASAAIELSDIVGDMNVRSTGSEAVRIKNIFGTLDVRTDGGPVEVEDSRGAVKIVAQRNVKVRGFAGPMDATSVRGTVELSLEESPQFDIAARSERGNTRITLPAASIFRLDSVSETGRVRIRGFEHLEVPRNEARRSVSFDPGLPGPLVKIRTGSGDILINSSGNALARSEGRP